MTASYQLHGLVVSSEVSIDETPAGPGRADVRIRWGQRRAIESEAPPGDLLATLEGPDRSWLSRTADGTHILRIGSLGDFELAQELDAVRVHLNRGTPEELAGVLIPGVLSTLLVLRGHCVLHASAVQTEDGVVAFIGGSGTGKTTVAALCCAAGALLVTDDVLRVEHDGGAGWCWSGSRELRLREQATELADPLGGAHRSTIDARLVVQPLAADPGRLPLTAIVTPVPDHLGCELQLDHRRGAEAVIDLVRQPRTLGWVRTETARRDFEVLSGLAATVPVFRARLPWGPPFSTAWGERLLKSLAIETAGFWPWSPTPEGR